MTPNDDMPRLWQDLTRAELAALRDRGALVVVPTGATEQHADHLPVGADTALAAGAAALAAARCRGTDVVVAPPLGFGFSPHHSAWAGTLSLRLGTYLAVLRDLALSVLETGFPRVLFVNGHGGNEAPLRALVTELVTDGHAVGMVSYFSPAEPDWRPMLKGGLARVGHACEYETAVMLALPDTGTEARARIEAAAADLPPRCVQPWMAEGAEDDPVTAAGAGWPPVFQLGDCGYYGDPAAADPASGAALLEVTVARLAAFYTAFAQAPLRVGARSGLAPVAGAA